MLRTNRTLTAAVCALALAGATAGAAFGGEVKGPPGIPGEFGSVSEEDTQAPTHANSICTFSGLNDFRARKRPDRSHHSVAWN